MEPKTKERDPDLGGEYWAEGEEAQRDAELGYTLLDSGKATGRAAEHGPLLYWRDPPSKAPDGCAFCHGCQRFLDTKRHFTATNFVYCTACTLKGLRPKPSDRMR